MKVCRICKESRDLSEFYKNKTRKDGLQQTCKDCDRSRLRDLYHKSPESWERNRKLQKAKARMQFEAYIANKSCQDCGNTDRRVLQQHHVENKDMEVSALVSGGYSWARIEEELKKCITLCANCHLIRHANVDP